MGYFLAVITSLLALFLGFLYVKRRDPDPDKIGTADLKGSINALLTDFNRVSNTNINILEEKIKDLHEVCGLADEKIQRLNGIMADLEILRGKVEKKKKSVSCQNLVPTTTAAKQYRRIRKLTSNHPTPDIVKELDMDSKGVEALLDGERRVH